MAGFAANNAEIRQKIRDEEFSLIKESPSQEAIYERLCLGAPADDPNRKFVIAITSYPHKMGKFGMILYHKYIARTCHHKNPKKVRTLDNINWYIKNIDQKASCIPHTLTKARELVLGERSRQIISELRMKRDSDHERIYAETRRPQSFRRDEDLNQNIQQTTREIVYQCEPQEKIGRYHNELLPQSLFKKDVDAYKEGALDAIQFYWDSESVERMILRTIEKPKPHYEPSSNGNSVRLPGRWQPALPGEIIKRLHPSWIDGDIQSCGPAIIGGLFGIESINDPLRSRISPIDIILDDMNIRYNRPHIRKQLKTLVHALSNGLEPAFADRYFRRDADIKLPINLTEHHIIRDMLKAIRLAKEAIQERGEMMGAWGVMKLGDQDIDSFFSCVTHTYEMQLLIPVYDIALNQRNTNHEKFDIPLYQYDGIRIKLRDKALKDKDRILSDLSQAVWNEGQMHGHGICANLIWE